MEPLCEIGQFLNKASQLCYTCPTGTFNAVAGRNLECAPCSKRCFSKNSMIKFLCNATHDLTCSCIDGYEFSRSGHCIPARTLTTEPSDESASDSVTSSYLASDDGDSWTTWFNHRMENWDSLSPLACAMIFVLFVALIVSLCQRYRRNQNSARRLSRDVESGSATNHSPFAQEKCSLLSDKAAQSTSQLSGGFCKKLGSGQFSSSGRNEDRGCNGKEDLSRSNVWPSSSLCAERFVSSFDFREDSNTLHEAAEGGLPN